MALRGSSSTWLDAFLEDAKLHRLGKLQLNSLLIILPIILKIRLCAR